MNREKFEQAQDLNNEIEAYEKMLMLLNNNDYELKIQSHFPLYIRDNRWSDVLIIDDELRVVIADFIDTRLMQLKKEFEEL